MAGEAFAPLGAPGASRVNRRAPRTPGSPANRRLQRRIAILPAPGTAPS